MNSGIVRIPAMYGAGVTPLLEDPEPKVIEWCELAYRVTEAADGFRLWLRYRGEGYCASVSDMERLYGLWDEVEELVKGINAKKEAL